MSVFSLYYCYNCLVEVFSFLFSVAVLFSFIVLQVLQVGSVRLVIRYIVGIIIVGALTYVVRRSNTVGSIFVGSSFNSCIRFIVVELIIVFSLSFQLLVMSVIGSTIIFLQFCVYIFYSQPHSQANRVNSLVFSVTLFNVAVNSSSNQSQQGSFLMVQFQ